MNNNDNNNGDINNNSIWYNNGLLLASCSSRGPQQLDLAHGWVPSTPNLRA